MTSRKPAVAWGIVVVSALVCLANGLAILGAVSALGQRPLHEVVATALLSAFVAGVSAFILHGTVRATFRSRWAVSLYLWGILIIYPAHNVLRAVGWYLPGPQLADTELAGAALAELIRYVVLLILIVWVALSKALKVYFSKTVPSVA